MKLLFCRGCNDVSSPYALKNEVRTCKCGKHSFWWDDPVSGHLHIYDRSPSDVWHYRRMAFVICVPNTFLEYPEPMAKQDIREILGGFSRSDVFGYYQSCIVRCRPEELSDVTWADRLPKKETVLYVQHRVQA